MLGKLWEGGISLLKGVFGSKSTVGNVAKYFKKNPWVGTAASYGIQRRDANRAHRRQMNDLKKAGINPILSAKLGGAQTPTMGDMGQTMNTARQIDQSEKITDSQVQKIEQEIENLITTEKVSQEQAKNLRMLSDKYIQEYYSLSYDNVYKQIIAEHQAKHQNITIARYYGSTAKDIVDALTKGKGKGKRK